MPSKSPRRPPRPAYCRGQRNCSPPARAAVLMDYQLMGAWPTNPRARAGAGRAAKRRAYGTFRVTNDLTCYTCAKLFDRMASRPR